MTQSTLETYLSDIDNLQKYIRLQTKQNFFYDTRSEDITLITKALCQFTIDLPQLKTDKSAMGRYRYQSLSAMLDDVNPILSKYGLKCSQPPHTIGTNTYVITTILHMSGQYLRCVTAIPDEYTMGGKVVSTNENLQAMGGAQTYIKRYALKSILGIDADDDTDGGATCNAQSNTSERSYSQPSMPNSVNNMYKNTFIQK